MTARTGRAGLAPMLALAAALAATPRAAAEPPAAARGRPTVVVTGTRVHLGDIVPGAEAAAAAIDLGPSPAAGVSRLVTRADIAAALGAKQVAAPAAVPDAVNVVRRARRLAPSEVDAIVRAALGAQELGHGVTLASVRADRAFDVADGWTRVGVDVPRAPKKAGTFTTTAIASLFVGDDVIARLPVPVDLAVSSDGATFEVARGATVTLVVRRSFVEVRAPGFAGADADVGDPVPIQLRPSGRVVRARLVSKDEALALDGDR
jgi:Chaperone for flagella basal body P-ring formation